ncbi:TIM barrel protein [Opitutales bacterium]|nr:TIM barrel protein [Opitutales bacterium]
MNPKNITSNQNLSRRGLLKSGIVGLAGVSALTGGISTGCANKQEVSSSHGRVGNIRQSVVSWCFSKHWSIEETCKYARELGCESVELIGAKNWPVLQKYGLTCAISPIDVDGYPFIKGFNNSDYHPWLSKVTREAIDESADFGCPNVIAFTGFSENFSLEEGARNCINGFKKIAGYAEKKGVTVCLEMLNSRVGDHPDKGHPGYQGDHVDYCLDILNAVGSPRVKLLFDVYHVQIMDGDVIRRIGECGDMIGHVHTAGNPGRGELDHSQELNYPPIMQALLDIGYKGFVGQEFIPTGDPLTSLRQAVELCDV